MVRINRTYSIEEDLVTKLKEEDNVSELINSLLIDFYNKSNSKDLKTLKNKIDGIETELDILRRERDRVADDIREVNAQTETNKEIKEKQIADNQHFKVLTSWLADKVKQKEITFSEYKNIKELTNWEDCVEAVMDGKLDLKELTTKAVPREEVA